MGLAHPPKTIIDIFVTGTFGLIMYFNVLRLMCYVVRIIILVRNKSQTLITFSNCFPTWKLNTLGPAYNEYGYYEHPVTTSNFLCTKFSPLTSMLKKSGYYEQIYLLSHLQRAKRSHCL